MREGDIFRWSYREPVDYTRYPYHCCSQIAIVDRYGVLRDTYWYGSSSDNRSFDPDDLDRIDLEYLGNLSDLNRVEEWKAEYYDDADIVDLNHANSPKGNFYIRKGAKRSIAKMLEVARYKLERSLAEERAAGDRSCRLRKAIAYIEAGQIDDVWL